MHLRPMLALLALPLSGLSTGCAGDKPPVLIPQVVERVIRPPAELLDCASEPAIPALALDTEETDYLAAALDAGSDCRARLADVKAFVGK